MSRNRRAGTLTIQHNGQIMDAVGNFSYNLGKNLKTGMVGPDRVHGFKSLPQVPMIEGEIRDASDLDLESLVTLEDATLTLVLANGKKIMLTEAWYAAEGTGQTEEANIQYKFEGMDCQEIK